MRLYPELPGPRNRQVRRDVLVLLALLLFAGFAWAVREAVLTLTAISTGFTDTAQGFQSTWSSVGDTLSGIPLVGDGIEDSMARLSDATVGSAIATGQSITESVITAANVLAFVTFAAPAAVLLVLWLPRRWDRSVAWTAAGQVLSPAVPRGHAPGTSTQSLLALRALSSLPLVDLVRFTPRPFEAFAAGDYAPLIRALYAHEGLRPPGAG